MDGLPKNKKPLRQPDQRDNIGLDSYLFERKLQEVYDVKTPRSDRPKPLKALKKVFKKRPKKLILQTQQAVKKSEKKRKKTQLIDAPNIAPKRVVVQPKIAKKRKKLTIMPHFKLQKTKLALKRHKPRVLALGVLAFAIGVGAFVWLGPNKPKTDVLGQTTDVVQKPDFEVLTTGQNQHTANIKFDPSKRVASYTDTLDGANLVINQQKLGETELKDTEFLRRTALSFNLNKEVITKKGQAFIGENIEKDTQFAFFIYNGFLFLIQSNKTLKYQTIVEYIDSLQ